MNYPIVNMLSSYLKILNNIISYEINLLYKKKISINFYKMVSWDSANYLDSEISPLNATKQNQSLYFT